MHTSTTDNQQKFNFIPFNESHYETYRLWFENEQIQEALYHIDEEWLDFVLNDKTGVEYAVLDGIELVAVVGIELPSVQNPFFAIKNIAVDPRRFRQGIGAKVLGELQLLYPLKDGQSWVAFVESKNVSAQYFFEKLGWNQIRVEDDMIRFELN